MRGNLAVKIQDASGERVVTRAVTGLRFRKTANGGHADASCTINIPRSQFPTLGPADHLYVYDTSTAHTIWDGYTNNPGTQTGRDGEGFELSALGGMSLATDQTERLVYLDASFDQWVADWITAQAPSSAAQIGQFPDGSGGKSAQPAIFCQFTPGQPIANTYKSSMRYRGLVDSPMTLGAIAGVIDGGLTSANYLTRFTTVVQTFGDANLSTAVAGVVYYAFVDYPAGATDPAFLLLRSAGGATTIGSDDIWGALGEVKVLGHLMDRTGTLLPMATASHITPGTATTETDAYVLADEVVEDLLGRIMTFCDPGRSVVDTTPACQIDQLAYTDAVRAAQVLDDLSLYEPDYLWEILESDQSGLHRFNYRAWPTTPRYVLPPSVVVEQPGGDVDLCNRIAVSWTDPNGDQQVTLIFTTVPELGSRTRDAEPITLPDGQGSAANALRIGTQVLLAKAAPSRSGTAVVDRPIIDLLRGVMAEPWEIEPGYLVRVTSTGEDLRLTETEYEDTSGSTTLTMGDPVLTIEQRIAMLQQTTATPRRIRR